MKKILFVSLLFIFAFSIKAKDNGDDREIKDDNFKFTIIIPSDWTKSDTKETADKDAISYTFERSDKKCAVMLLAFKLTAVKNLDDFVYTMEKDGSLNIPAKNGEYSASDNGSFDSKAAMYKDSQYTEHIFYFRTKLPDAPTNYVYMLRFITGNSFVNSDLEKQITKISNSFLPTAQ